MPRPQAHHRPQNGRVALRYFRGVATCGAVAAFLGAGSLSAQQEAGAAEQDLRIPPGRRSMTAERLREGEGVTLDGLLDEAVWQRAVPATDFIQQDPDFGAPPTERTEVRVAFDGENFYMGVYCFDSEPDGMLGNTMKRDETLQSDDRFMWVMDTFLDQQTGYFFEMNPWGLMGDALQLADGGNERAWDGIWDAYARRSDIGWTIEVKIPLRTLNFDPEAPAWGINFQRTVRRKGEEQLWTGYERNQGLRRMSNTGLLYGISNVSQGHGLDVKPYVAAVTFDAPGGPSPAPRRTSRDVGLDLFYSFAPTLKGNLTINTDFAQTEVDQRLVNLTRFPLRFPEKRDFFLDGAPFFTFASTGVEPFFSRRIGLTSGVPQPIDVGAKLVGRAGDQDIGFLHVRTGEETRVVGGQETKIVGEDFTVLRLKRRVLTQSYLGTFFSRRHARSSGPSDDLYTAGLDFRLATSAFRGSDNLDLTGSFLWSTNPLDTGDNLAYGFELNYPNDPWTASLGFTEVQANHNPAVGFVSRRGFRRYSPQVGFGLRPRSNALVRRVNFGINADALTDMENLLVTRTVDLTVLGVMMQSEESFQMHVVPTYERLHRDFPIHEGVVLPEGRDHDFTRYRLQVGTAARRILSATSSFEFGDFYSGNRKEVAVGLGVRPRPGVRVNLQNEWNSVELPEGRFQTRLLRLVSDTQFNPWVYVVNNLQYDSVSERLGWQFRLRWTVDPGNDFYFVYTHNWLDDVLQDRFVTQDRRAAAKFVYTYRW
ncbi:MAG: hydrolase [Gemmatimonadetes bacterium]|nr:hydrolase [Gemmatimonadota bacterium]